MHAAGTQYGSIGRLIVEAQGDARQGQPGRARPQQRRALLGARVAPRHGDQPDLRPRRRWMRSAASSKPGCFISSRSKVTVKPIRKIEEPRWAWHIGLDAESTAILNELWAGERGRARPHAQHPRAVPRWQFDESGGDARRHRRPLGLSGARVGRGRRGEDEAAEPAASTFPGQPVMKPDYWDRAKRASARRDPVMGAIMRRHPRVLHDARAASRSMTLARAIVGQQISVKAAQSVWNRLFAALPAVTPDNVLSKAQTAAARLRPVGPQDRVHRRPRAALRRRQVHVHRWPEMSDEEMIAELVAGARHRPLDRRDVPDVQPAAARRVPARRPRPAERASGSPTSRGRKVSLKRMRKLGETWRPWRSVATWYLWRSLDPVPVEY